MTPAVLEAFEKVEKKCIACFFTLASPQNLRSSIENLFWGDQERVVLNKVNLKAVDKFVGWNRSKGPQFRFGEKK